MLAGEADLVLRRGQLFLEGENVLVRLQLRVVLHDREEGPERPGQGVLRLDLRRPSGVPVAPAATALARASVTRVRTSCSKSM